MPPEPQQKPGGSVVLRLAGDCVAAAAASVAVSPVVTAMDRAITRNAAGAQRLWPAMFEGLGQLIKQPIRNVRSTPTKWLMLVYSATYAGANAAHTLSVYLGIKPALPVLAASTIGNMSTGIAKDRAFARMYGVVAAKGMPLPSYGLFFSRDVLAMAFVFTLPPLVTPAITKAVDDYNLPLTPAQTSLATRLTTPVVSQLFSTPLHLLGLAVYNNTGGGVAAHLQTLRETYPETVTLRMLRIIPAFSVGGVVNTSLRERWHDALERRSFGR